MARLRYLQNKRSGAAGTISKADKRIYFYDDNAYIYAASSGVLHIVATTINIDGNFAFTGTDKLHLGTSSANLTLTAGTPVLQVYTNCSSEHASTTAVPSMFNANMDTAAGVGRALEAVLTVEDVKLGSWSNAIKGKIDFETSGSGAGLLSAICAEMIMPAATMGGYGNYAPLEIEFVCPLTWAGSPQSVSFMNINLAAGSTGDTTGNFDDIGYLMVVNGLDDATTHCLYDNTLRIKIDTATWYLPMSSAEASYTTAYPIVSSAQIKTTLSTGVAMYVNSTATAAGSYGMYSLITGTYTSGGCWAVYGDITWSHATSGYPTMYGVCGRATVNDNYTGGTGYVYAVSGQLHFTNDTIINNGSSVFAALCGVITSDATPTFTTGHITCLYLDNLCSAADLADTAGVNSFIYMANNSGGKDLDDAIYLYGPDVLNFMRFQGCTSIVSSTYTTPLHGTLCKKIKISLDGTTYYLLASTAISD